jgi:hypothetical protein
MASASVSASSAAAPVSSEDLAALDGRVSLIDATDHGPTSSLVTPLLTDMYQVRRSGREARHAHDCVVSCR